MQLKYDNKLNGSVMVEILVAFGLFTLLLPALLTGLISSVKGGENLNQRIKAIMLLREGEEALRSIREVNWNGLSVGTFHPEIVNGSWSLSGNSEVIDGFTRSIILSDVDPSLKIATIDVSWNNGFSRNISSITYLSRYFGNKIFSQSKKAQFDLGIKVNTTVTNISDGEVSLGAGGKADWCEPSLSAITPIDLPKSGVANAITAIEGVVFAGTGDNSSGVSFAKVNIANTDPPTGSLVATFDGYKTNGVFGDGSFAYLATDNNSKEIEIINLSSIIGGKYQEAGSFNAPGNGNGTSVFATSNYGYMTSSSGNKFYNFNKPGNSLSIDLDGVTLDNMGKKVFVVGNYAYVVTDGASNQLNIIDISNPSNLTKIKSFSVNGDTAKDIYVNTLGTRAYIVTAESGSKPEFFIIDITNKLNPVVLGTYDSQGMSPKGVTIVPGNKAIIVGTSGSQQYQVIDIVNENAPTHCTSGGRSGGLSITSGVNGISSVLESDGDAYSYIITGDASNELKIIEGGPGGKYASSGSFESSIFDMGSEVAFNNFIGNVSTPSGTTVSYQFSGADPVSGSCNSSSFSYVDPLNNYEIPLSSDGIGYENPARCFRYKILFTTNDSAYTPSFNDISINYSP